VLAILRPYSVSFVDINDVFDKFREAENSMKRKRLEPTAACDDLLVEITDGPIPQITSPKSPSSSDADRENPISYRLDEVVACRNATSPFRG
jgi:hypothetical protein